MSRSQDGYGAPTESPRASDDGSPALIAARRRSASSIKGRKAAFGALAVLLGLAFVAPAMLPSPTLVDFDGGLSALGAPLPPSWRSPLGTDELGRDVLARVCSGLRLSLATSAIATAIAVAVATAIGVGMAALRSTSPLLGAALSRTVDVVMALPVLLFAMLATVVVRADQADGAALGPWRATLVVAIVLGLWVWTNAARIIAARTQVLLGEEMILAARALGGGPWRIFWRHLLPNLRPLISAVAIALFAHIALADAALSFLGLGAPPPTASLGRMVLDGRPFFRVAPWLLIAPGAALILLATTFYALASERRPDPERA